MAMKVIKSTAVIQKTRYSEGVVAQLGINKDVFRCPSVELNADGKERVISIMLAALDKARDVIANECDDVELALLAMEENIKRFNLVSASGFTTVHEARLKDSLPTNVFEVGKAKVEKADAVEVECDF